MELLVAPEASAATGLAATGSCAGITGSGGGGATEGEVVVGWGRGRDGGDIDAV